MSDFGEEIINRLSENSPIRNPNHPMYKIIDRCIGEWLQEFDDKEFFNQFFLQEATGKYLDLQGKTYNVKRRIDEDDESYRKRIIHMTLSHLTVDFLRDVYDIQVYSSIVNFNTQNNDLTSDNPYLSANKYMGIADEDTQRILNNKFVIGSDFRWL